MLIIHALHEISPCNTVSNEHLVAIYSFPNEAVYSWNISKYSEKCSKSFAGRTESHSPLSYKVKTDTTVRNKVLHH